VTTDTKQKPELTKIRPGHWRNLWRDPLGQVHARKRAYPADDVIAVNEFEYLSRFKHVSREQAEQFAIKQNKEHPDIEDVWIDAVFFPE